MILALIFECQPEKKKRGQISRFDICHGNPIRCRGRRGIMNSKAVAICYLCRKRPGTTRDHVPPKNLFPRPRPSSLVTVPCCEKCNNRFSKHDEYFRLFASCCINRSSE